MELSKQVLLRSGNIEHQTALVKKLQKQGASKVVKHKIPGGKHLTSLIGQEQLPEAIYNWLRRVNNFKKVRISFAQNPEAYPLKTISVQQFDMPGPQPIWEMREYGKKWLAEQIADVINKRKCVAINVDEQGITIDLDTSEEFRAHRKATATDVEQSIQTRDIYIQNMQKRGVPAHIIQQTKAEWDLIEEGDTIPTEDWEPYLEFVPKMRNQYTPYRPI